MDLDQELVDPRWVCRGSRQDFTDLSHSPADRNHSIADPGSLSMNHGSYPADPCNHFAEARQDFEFASRWWVPANGHGSNHSKSVSAANSSPSNTLICAST